MRWLSSTVLLLSLGCATTATTPAPTPPTPIGGPPVVDVTTGEVLEREEVVQRLAGVRHVYVGEHHTSPPHHQVQLEVVQALHEAGRPVAIGVEWLPAQAQPAIDAYLAGRIDEATFLDRARWKDRWGFDFTHYAPIFRWAREAGVPVWGLNAPDGLARAVGRHGTESLPIELKAMLPPLDTGNAAHRAFFEAMMKAVAHAHGGHGHGHGQGDDGWLDRYYQAQLVRDESMSRNLREHLRRDPGRTAVVFAGLGHVDHGHGVPLRAERLLDAPFKIVLPLAPGTLEEHGALIGARGYPAQRADYLWEAKPPLDEAAAR